MFVTWAKSCIVDFSIQWGTQFFYWDAQVVLTFMLSLNMRLRSLFFFPFFLFLWVLFFSSFFEKMKRVFTFLMNEVTDVLGFKVKLCGAYLPQVVKITDLTGCFHCCPNCQVLIIWTMVGTLWGV